MGERPCHYVRGEKGVLVWNPQGEWATVERDALRPAHNAIDAARAAQEDTV